MKKRLAAVLLLSGATVCAGMAGIAMAQSDTETMGPPKPKQSQPQLPGSGSTLGMNKAVALALDRNFQIKAARSEIGGARGRFQHSRRWTPSNPRLEFDVRRRNAPGPGGHTSDLGIRVSQELWIGGQGSLMADAAESRLQGARARLGYLETAVAARTREAFLNLLVADEAVQTAQRVVEVTKDIASTSRQRLEAGEATRLEVNTSRIGLGRAQSALAEAKADHNRAELTLAELLAVETPLKFDLEGTFATEPLDIPARNQLLNEVVARREDLAAAATEVAASRKELALSRRQLIPNFTVFGFAEREESDDIAGIGLSVPLPVLHQYGGERKEAAAKLEQAQIERDSLLLQIRLEMERAISDYRAAVERIRAVSEGMLAAAEENVSLVFEGFRAGQTGVSAIATSQESLLQARRAYLDAQRALASAASNLERASGGLLFIGDMSAQTDSNPDTE